MSYVSLIKSLAEILGQPTGIAVMASAGIHAVVGFTLPYMPGMSSEQSQLPRTVQVVALTPDQQNRIPELATLPVPPSIYQQTPLNSPFPPLPPLNPSFKNYNYSKVSPSRSNLKSLLQQQAASKGKLDRNGLKIYDSPVWKSQVARRTPLKVWDPSQSNLQIARNSDGVPVLNPNPQVDIGSLPPPPVDNTSGQNSTPLPDGQQVATKVATESGQQENTITADNRNTTSDEARKNYVAWLNQLNQQQQSVINQQQPQVTPVEPGTERIEGTYPKDACTQKLEGATVVGVLVGADSQLSDLRLIRSAGYPIFDQQAQQEVKSYRFSNQTGQPKPYLVTVAFKYKEANCQAANQTPPQESDRNQPQETNQTAPQEADRNQPQDTNQTAPQDAAPTKPEETNQTTPQNTDRTKPQEANRTVPQPSERARTQEAHPLAPQEVNRTAPQPSEQAKPQQTNRQQTNRVTPQEANRRAPQPAPRIEPQQADRAAPQPASREVSPTSARNKPQEGDRAPSQPASQEVSPTSAGKKPQEANRTAPQPASQEGSSTSARTVSEPANETTSQESKRIVPQESSHTVPQAFEGK
ncbi:MAG TPA: hypothetical protein DDZ80_13100 [Cyanobacteria bacterium UBA8803]|nr:hypothetical protein [Cyanobacteria bacterium UBA9273]HBL59409.1 hypothetical protein [Cyanobacteria bacterium UBA8803]